MTTSQLSACWRRGGHVTVRPKSINTPPQPRYLTVYIMLNPHVLTSASFARVGDRPEERRSRPRSRSPRLITKTANPHIDTSSSYQLPINTGLWHLASAFPLRPREQGRPSSHQEGGGWLLLLYPLQDVTLSRASVFYPKYYICQTSP